MPVARFGSFFDALEKHFAISHTAYLQRLEVILCLQRQKLFRIICGIEVAFHDARATGAQLRLYEIVEHPIAGYSHFSRPLTIAPTKLVEEEFFNTILVDKRKIQVLSYTFAQRRFAGTRGPQNGDQRRFWHDLIIDVLIVTVTRQ